MEGPDGYMRTMPDTQGNDINPGSDSDGSDMQFASDDEREGDDKKSNFFTEGSTAPAAWSFEKVRESARAPHDFQTTIDAKIRSAREKFTVRLPKNDGEEQEEKDGPKNEKGPDEPESDESGDEDEDEDDVDKVKKDEKMNKKSKKRQRQPKPDNSTAISTFMDLHLSKPLQKAIQNLQWTKPTAIQERAIPYILAGRDVCASAVTGSGKTAAFLLPIIERLLQAGIDNLTRVIILLPTRELAAQCHSVLESLCKYTSIRGALVVGGLNGDNQQVALRTRPHVVIATPGRLIDHIRNSSGFAIDNIEVMILDEGDRLLDMGFESEVKEILTYLPEKRQTLLFSATLTSNKLKSLIQLSLTQPIHINISEFSNVSTNLQQEFVKIRANFEESKESILLALISRTFLKKTIIFFRQKVTTHRFKILLGLASMSCAELHGNLTQSQRLLALEEFKNGDVDFLLCTDLAARGLDILGVETVVNYDVPLDIREYIHRVGRTARAGNSGTACSLVCIDNNDERKLVKAIAKRASSLSDGKELTARVIPVSVIGKWKVWVDGVENAVRQVLKEERQEKELRKAEMEVQKAQNMMKYSDKIYSRPAKTWFQSEDQKLEDKGKVRKELGLNEMAKNDKSKSAGKKRKAEEMQKRKEENEKRRRKEKIMARQEDYAKQRLDARKLKRKTTPGSKR